ncbi:peptidyl-prolyl cis-trans isomerase C [Thalassolituus maritimus]|uniref:Peptidyl-prolyl cis-trans isomerase C n=1 Tax=Thalassolituus maritimus TaxID=484498 RepID=A0A1N7NU38_9GAMM|nr:peptidylprolyl isomerase [Thalassolituus maritimus]SIT01812.1 peptidyl-prolyl cis-trans isomerase C [Thalassolituus maritimus]
MTIIPLNHILLKSPLLADDILKELTLGARFEDLAAEHSACPSGSNKGFAGNHDVDDLPEEMIQAMQEYDGSCPWIGPVKTHYGFHIIRPAGQIGELRERIDDLQATDAQHEEEKIEKQQIDPQEED